MPVYRWPATQPVKDIEARVLWLVGHWRGCATQAGSDSQCGQMRAEVWRVCAADLEQALTVPKTAAQ